MKDTQVDKMLKIGDKITIRFSKKLAQNGNTLLVNRIGVITRILTNAGEIVGVYADVEVMRKLRNYYIPINSIEGVDEINKLRTLSILKSTFL